MNSNVSFADAGGQYPFGSLHLSPQHTVGHTRKIPRRFTRNHRIRKFRRSRVPSARAPEFAINSAKTVDVRSCAAPTRRPAPEVPSNQSAEGRCRSAAIVVPEQALLAPVTVAHRSAVARALLPVRAKEPVLERFQPRAEEWAPSRSTALLYCSLWKAPRLQPSGKRTPVRNYRQDKTKPSAPQVRPTGVHRTLEWFSPKLAVGNLESPGS